MSYSLTGKNVDTITIDSGVSALHPEFLDGEGTTRVKDVILDVILSKWILIILLELV